MSSSSLKKKAERWLFPVTLLICSLQLIPLFVGLDLSGSICEQSLREVNVKIIAGYGLGFLTLLLIDLLIDTYSCYFNFWYSRIVLFITSCLYSILILVFSEVKNIAAIYECFIAFSSILLVSRALSDLYEKDINQIWTLPKIIALISLVSLGGVIGTIGLMVHGIYYTLSRIFFYVFEITFIILFVFFSYQCITAILKKVSMYSSFSVKYKKLMVEDVFVLVIMTVALSSLVLLSLLPAWTTRFQDFSHRNSFFICSDLVIRLTFASLLMAIPSVLLKHQALTLQIDLDTKRAFVRCIY